MTLPAIAIRAVQKKIITCQCIGNIIGAVSVIGNYNQDVHDHDDHYKGILLVVIMA